jgi:hypothetical protein
MHKSIDEVWPSVENLRLKATRFFTLFNPTHVSIVISDIIQKYNYFIFRSTEGSATLLSSIIAVSVIALRP